MDLEWDYQEKLIGVKFWILKFKGKRGRMTIEKLNNKDADVVWVFRSEVRRELINIMKFRKSIMKTVVWIRENSLKFEIIQVIWRDKKK